VIAKRNIGDPDVITPTSSNAKMPGGSDANEPQVAASQLTLPPCWTHKPELWFAMVEAKFNLATPKITKEDTKFSHGSPRSVQTSPEK
jgi:hypothetical protein